MEIRLQKILAQAGYGSRRSCEDIINAGRVTVNGRVATIGVKANPEIDQIKVDFRLIRDLPGKRVYIVLNKPKFVLSDRQDNDQRKSVFDLVKWEGHLFSVGRLDYDSEGLILLTNDGDLANKLTHPRYGHEKEYRVLLTRRPDEEQLKTWRRGVLLEDGYKTAPAFVEIDQVLGKGAWIKVIMKEGRKRQIREIGARIGLPVARIIRVRISSVVLGKIKPGESRFLTTSEIASLKSGYKSIREKKNTRSHSSNI